MPIAVNKIRNRLVTFRVTGDEFDQLREAADHAGARCLSDFARAVMLGVVVRRGSPSSEAALLKARLREIEHNLATKQASLVAADASAK